jgi:hypothetical protein
MGAPIRVEENPAWTSPATRLANKYSPVIVTKNQGAPAVESMQEVLRKRIRTCQTLGLMRDKTLDSCGWFSFIRGGPSHEPHLRSTNVPVIVISGGSANKIAADLARDYSLAWHPMNLRNEPLYLLVHRRDYDTYAAALAGAMGRFRNMHLIGWDGGRMTGFGAARAAALAFADSLPYRPKRILMMDQDVIQTEGTRHTRPELVDAVERKHLETGKPVVGLGVGYPTRVPLPKTPFKHDLGQPTKPDLNSPAQQFVSIQAPFRQRTRDGSDGIYPAYMVAGGEDMLMGMQLKLMTADENVTLLGEKILKKELKGEADTPNAYWNKARVDTLQALFEAEKDTQVQYDGTVMSLDDLMKTFVRLGWVASHPSAESYGVSACVVERIILRLHKEGNFPSDVDTSVFNRVQPTARI